MCLSRFLKYCLFSTIAIIFFGIQSAFAVDVIELHVNGTIGPASADYLIRGIEKGRDSEFILVRMDTPGGLDKSTRQIVQAFLSSKRPIVVYIAPNGARAASAGTFLVYASTIAAMAPSTHLGAASPVNIAAGMSQEDKEKKQKSTMDKKITNDTIAYIRSLAQLRNRNVEFSQKAILDAATLTAKEALDAGVIDLIAKNNDDLFKQLDGRVVIQDGHQIKLNTKDVNIKKIIPDWRIRLLLIITDPTVAYLLLLLGIYGIFFELMNPGFVLPGVIGGVSILIALYALQLLPINYAGLGLIILGICFVIAEAFTPSFGILGLGGTLSFVIGSILLIDTSHQAFQIALPVIWLMALLNLLLFIFIFTLLVRSRLKPGMHGASVLVGLKGQTLNTINLTGQVLIQGEIWSAKSDKIIESGKPVRVVATDGLTLQIEEPTD